MEMKANTGVPTEPTAAPPTGTSSRPEQAAPLRVPKQEVMDDDVVAIVPPEVQEEPVLEQPVQEQPDVVAQRKAVKLTDDVVNATFAAQCAFGNLPIDLEGAQKAEFDEVEGSLNKFHLEVKTFAADKVWSMDGFKRIVKNATVPVYAMRNFESGFEGKEDVEREDYKKSIKEAADNLKATVNELRKEKDALMISIEESAYLGVRESKHKLRACADIKKEQADNESAQSLSQPPVVHPEDSAPTVPMAVQEVPTSPSASAPTTVPQEPAIPSATTEAPSTSAASTVSTATASVLATTEASPTSAASKEAPVPSNVLAITEAPSDSAASTDAPTLETDSNTTAVPLVSEAHTDGSALSTPIEAPTTSGAPTFPPGLPAFSAPTGIPVSSTPPTPVAPPAEEITPVNDSGDSTQDTTGRYSPNPSMDFEPEPVTIVSPSAVGSDVTRKRFRESKQPCTSDVKPASDSDSTENEEEFDDVPPLNQPSTSAIPPRSYHKTPKRSRTSRKNTQTRSENKDEGSTNQDEKMITEEVEEKADDEEEKYDELYMSKALVVLSKNPDEEENFPEAGQKVLAEMEEDEGIKEKHGEPCVVPLSTEFSEPNGYRGVAGQLKNSYRVIKKKRGNGQRKECLNLHPQFMALQSSYMDPLNSTANEIVENAKRGRGNVVSSMYESKLCYTDFLRNVTNAVVDKETRLLAAHSEENRKICETQVEADFTPFPYMDVTNLVDDIEHIKRLLATSSGFGLRGLEAVCGIDRKKFSLENIFSLGLDQKVETRHNLPQSTNTNFSYLAETKEIESLGLKSQSYLQNMYTLREIQEHYNVIKELGIETRRKIAANPDQKNQLLVELQGKLNECVLKIETKKGIVTPQVYLPAFCTNIDMRLECFKSLMEELDRLPDCLKPNQETDLLRIVDEALEGISTPQMYLKLPVSRTNFHCEFGMFVSVNWNFGPHDCIWYFVPPEYLCELWALIHKDQVNAEMDNPWPTPDRVIKAGIPLQKVIQKPMDFIVVGMGSPHWVQSVGFAVNVSWNIAPTTHTQLCLAAIQNDRHKMGGKNPLIPLENLQWQMAIQRQRLELDQDTKEFLKFGLMRPNGSGRRKKPQLKAHIRYTTEELAEIFDSIDVNAAT
ncbi:hypothetical protein CAEBREN_22339 [Caenorhabditis brenneri]|uniref:JmjC domain-containing protein n=1 Tax=Caenorhabditis brenneri TaxID=135651 RepID=G0MAE9_CAEBE|nr:hypothetical protein CAEBREN_22339 [Caenorhabditis brenneri]